MSPHPPPPPPPISPTTSLPFMLSSHTAPYANSTAEDAIYIAKYKEMKRKVKEIELDNDRLHIKCLKVRKNIQRLRLERAILYERMASMSGAQGPSNILLPPSCESGSVQHSPALKHGQSHRVGLSPIVYRPEALSPNKVKREEQEVPNGNARTFPFVLEYPTPRERRGPGTGSGEYPAELKFHQYEGSPERRPTNRNKKDHEKGSKQKRQQELISPSSHTASTSLYCSQDQKQCFLPRNTCGVNSAADGTSSSSKRG